MRRAPFVASCNVSPSASQQEDQSESWACRNEQTELFEDAGHGIRLIVYLYFSVCGAHASPAAQTALSHEIVFSAATKIIISPTVIYVRDNYQPPRRDYNSLISLSLKSEVNASCC